MKFKRIFVLLLGGLVLCLFSVNIFANDLKFKISNNDVKIELNGEKHSLNFENKMTYELCDEVESISHFVTFNDFDGFTIILHKSYDDKQFTAEIIFSSDENQILTDLFYISSNDYFSLISNSQKISWESSIGFSLRYIETLFQQNYYKNMVFDTERSMDRNYTSFDLEEMTSTDSYIDSYYPTKLTNDAIYPRFNDNIINIVPEEWFYKTGENTYIGLEYGIHTSTRQIYNTYFKLNCFVTDVTIWDFESSIPCLGKSKNSPYTFSENEYYELSVKEKINYSYIAFKRNLFEEDEWIKFFDPTEDRIILMTKESSNRFFIAPSYNNFAIENYNYDKLMPFEIRTVNYSFIVENAISKKIERTSLRHAIFQTIGDILKVFDDVDESFGFIGNLIKFMSSNLEKTTLNKIKDEDDEVKFNSEKCSYSLDYSGIYVGGKRKTNTSSIVKNDNKSYYSNVFSSKILANYEHNYFVDFTTTNRANDEYNFTFADLSIYDVYDCNGNIVSANYLRKAVYDKLIQIYPNNTGSDDPYVVDNSNIYAELKNITGVKVITPQQTGVYKFKSSNSNMKLEIYNQNGHLLAKTSKKIFENACCAYLETDKIYIVRYLQYDTSSSNTTSISINYIKNQTEITKNCDI